MKRLHPQAFWQTLNPGLPLPPLPEDPLPALEALFAASALLGVYGVYFALRSWSPAAQAAMTLLSFGPLLVLLARDAHRHKRRSRSATSA